jgi:hypothetical protein
MITGFGTNLLFIILTTTSFSKTRLKLEACNLQLAAISVGYQLLAIGCWLVQR